MRPPDENQDGTKNILARLERQGPQHASRSSGAGIRLALVGGSGLMVVGLIGLLVSLGQENLASPPLTELAEASQAAEFVEPPAPRKKVPVILPPDERHVTTIDTRKKSPAMVMLPKPLAPASDKKKVVKHAVRPAPKPVAQKTAAKPTPAPARKVKIAVAPPPPPAPPAPVRIEPLAVDTDIALLTALLSTSTRHQVEVGEQEAAACAAAMAQSRKCLDKAASRP